MNETKGSVSIFTKNVALVVSGGTLTLNGVAFFFGAFFNDPLNYISITALALTSISWVFNFISSRDQNDNNKVRNFGKIILSGYAIEFVFYFGWQLLCLSYPQIMHPPAICLTIPLGILSILNAGWQLSQLKSYRNT